MAKELTPIDLYKTGLPTNVFNEMIDFVNSGNSSGVKELLKDYTMLYSIYYDDEFAEYFIDFFELL